MKHNGLSAAPLISFVIPVYNAAAYLTKCLDSITLQPFTGIEIIAVDGGSEDGSRRILDERTHTEPRLKVLHEGRIGPGSARNLGVQHAKGQYLWFVDGDDVIANECLTTIADRLHAIEPDVLIVGYEAERRTAEPRFRPWSSSLQLDCDTSFTVADRPEILDLTVAPWNKIVRRDFFLGLGLQYPAAWPHEDVPVSCQLLLGAQELYVLDRVCYRYHVDRPGSAMKAGDQRRHFLIFDAWRTVLDDAQIQAKSGDSLITAEVYSALFERSISHCSNVLDMGGFGVGRIGSGGYVARCDRKEFFRMLHGEFGKYAPVGYRPGRGFRGIKYNLIRRGAYGTYCVLDPLNRIRNRLRLSLLGITERGPVWTKLDGARSEPRRGPDGTRIGAEED